MRQVGIGVDVRLFAPADATVIEAIESGRLTLSPAIPFSIPTVTQSSVEGEPRIAALTLPVYESMGVPDSIEARDEKAVGVLAVILYTDLLVGTSAGPGATAIRTELYDGPGVDDGELVSSIPIGRGAVDASGLTRTETVDLFGRSWTFEFTALEGFTDAGAHREPWLYLVGGVAASLMLFALVYALLRSRNRALQMVDEATVELRASEERYRQAFEDEHVIAERLREVDHLKSEFMAMVTHELRTPLTAAAPFVDTVLGRWDDLDDDQRRELLGRASGNARDLGRLIGQLLEFARLDNEETTVAPRPTQLRGLVDDVMRQGTKPSSPFVIAGWGSRRRTASGSSSASTRCPRRARRSAVWASGSRSSTGSSSCKVDRSRSKACSARAASSPSPW